MNFDKKILGNRIKQLRIQNSITLDALSKEIGITRSALGNIEHGRKGTSLETTFAIADYFDVSIDYLVGRKDEP